MGNVFGFITSIEMHFDWAGLETWFPILVFYHGSCYNHSTGIRPLVDLLQEIPHKANIQKGNGSMLKLLICTALMYLPIALPCGILCFFVARWCLQRKNRIAGSIVRTGLPLCLIILAVGIIYGALRFSGTILFADDNTISYNWFDSSWRDDGFGYIYRCAVAFIGIGAAVLFEKRSKKQTSIIL